MVRIKICCITSQEEADLARAHGAHAIGLVSWMPSGEGMIPDERIRGLAAANADLRRFLLTCRTDADTIVEQARHAGTDTLQLVDRVEPEAVAAIRAALPELSIVQVVHVNGPEAIAEAEQVEPHVDALLLDSGTPDAPRRTLGGTGHVHDWEVSAEIVRRLDCPVFLAGGLGADNVGEAIRRVRPYGVDVCSRLRPAGRLDEPRLAAFVAAVAEA